MGNNVETKSTLELEHKMQNYVQGKTPINKTNIYLFVYESYVPYETMLGYGFDNSSQIEFISGQGFKVYPNIYSIGRLSLESMSRVLNASTDTFGRSRRAVSGDGVVQNILKNVGYETYGIFYSDYMFRGIGSSYDSSLPQYNYRSDVLLLSAILMGEFTFDLGCDYIPYDQYIETKRNIPLAKSTFPKFVYTHNAYPGHSQNSGVCRPNETDLYFEGVKKANLEMKQDIEILINNDPDAIIIVAGDHGPYLTKNCKGTGNEYNIAEITRLDIQDRFGTFLAIRWPTEEYEIYDDITVLQDLFVSIFAYMYEDPTILKFKIEPEIVKSNRSGISGVSVNNGIIIGGINDGEPLFLLDN